MDQPSANAEPTSEPSLLLRLRDGRALSYLDLGAPDGRPLFHFHGHGSSRLEALVLDRAARRAQVRVLAFDRPGIGRSDPKGGDRLLDWPADIQEAADLLGIERFAVQGMSAGGPYALACAHALGERIQTCSLVSAVPPPEIARRSGPFMRQVAWWVAFLFPNYLRRRLQQYRSDEPPSREVLVARVKRMAQWLGGNDLSLIEDPALLDLLTRTLAETARQTGAANRTEIERLARSWGFKLREVRTPVLLWHGAKDRILPLAPARLMARKLRHCAATYYPDDGHFSILVNHAEDLMMALQTGL